MAQQLSLWLCSVPASFSVPLFCVPSACCKAAAAAYSAEPNIKGPRQSIFSLSCRVFITVSHVNLQGTTTYPQAKPIGKLESGATWA